MKRHGLASYIPLFLLLTAALAGLAGCGSGPKPTVTIATPATTNIDPGDAITLTATVDHGSGEGVTWTMTGTGCSGSACGALSNQSSTSATYTAPGTVATTFTVTITATSVKDKAVTGTVTLNIPANPAITTALGALTAGQVGSTYTVTVAISGGVSPYTWTVKSGNLPTGLMLGASSGTISGTPTASGNYTFTLQVTDSGSPTALSASGAFSIDIAPAPAIVVSTAPLANGVIGTAYTGAVTATGGAGTLTYAVTGGSLPAGLKMSTGGAITGTPTTAGKSSFTVTASDAYGDTGTGNLSITITYPQLTITTASLPTGYAGTAYPSTTLASGGGTGTGLTWTWAAATGSSLPGGLTLSTGGVITGTPTAAGTFDVVFTVTDSAMDTANATLAITIDPAVSVTTATLPTGYAGSVYTQTTLAAAGGAGSPYTWTWAAATGSTLPGGLSLSSGGVISGTPTTAGTYSVVVTAKDSVGNTGSRTLTITVDSGVSVTTTALPAGTINVAYPSTTLAATGGAGSPYTWTWAAATGSTLPAGLSLSTGGVISGTPTTAGTYSVVVTAKDSVGNTGQATLSIVIESVLTITTTSLPTGYVGAVYPTTTLAAAGGTGTGYAWTWAAATGYSLPSGLSLSTGGVITGTPLLSGTLSVVFTVTDSAKNTASATIVMMIDGPVKVTTSSLPVGYAGSAYTQTTLVASGGAGGPYTWTWAAATGSSLPAGLTLSSGGVITGTPTTTGVYSVVVTAKDSANNTGSATLTLTINGAVSITTTSLPGGYQGTPYTSTQLAATGGAGSPYTWTWAAAAGSSLPTGLTLSTGGLLSGTPTAGGTFNVVITAKDSASNTAQATFAIVIEAALAVTTTSVPTGYVGVTYPTTSLVATGGTGTGYAWTWAAATGSSLPPGLSLSGGGVITGSPTTPGTYNVVVTAKDSASHTATGNLTITVNPGVSVTTTSLPTGYAGSAYPQTTLAATGGAGSPYTWTWTAATGSSLPAGMMLSSGGVITGTPTTTGVYSVVVTAKDSAGNTGSAMLSLTVNAGVTITSSTPPQGYQGTAYPSFSFAATGGTGTYTWTWAAGSGSSIPAGLSLSSAGAVTGTPTAYGTFSVVVTAKDGAGNTASVTFSITIVQTLAITTTSLPSGAVSETYTSTTVKAVGGVGTDTWSMTGAPPGLSINSTSGVIGGTPTTQGTYNSVVVTVTDTASHTADATFSITINATLAITTGTLPGGTVGVSYSTQIVATGGTGGNTWSIASGALGNNLTLNASTGVISSSSPTLGTSTFTVQVKDSSGDTATSGTLTISIFNALGINASALPLIGYTGNVEYTGTVSGTGGSGNFCWNVTGLTDNLTVPANNATCGYDSSSITISGEPTTAETVPVTVKVTDTLTNASVSQVFDIVISAPQALTLPPANPSSLGSATVNESYSGSITATGGVGPTFTWTVNGLGISQAGLSVGIGDNLYATTSDNNVLTVTTENNVLPNTAETITFTAQVADNYGHTSSTVTYSIVVNPQSQITGQIFLNNGNFCGSNSGSYTLPTITVSINTSPIQTTTTDSSGNYSFMNVPNGTYTITPSITGPESIFFPATITGVAINNNSATDENFNVNLGYTVSGTISYAGTETGTTYIGMQPVDCGGDGYPGTSLTEAKLTSGGAYTVRGVPPGVYTASVWMDPIGQGQPNVIDPSGSSVAFTVSDGNVTAPDAALTNPTLSAPTDPVKLKGVAPTNLGAVISFGGGSVENSSGIEEYTSYTIEWSTTTTGFSASDSATFQAIGAHTNIWILNNGIKGISGSFTNGDAYYFRVEGTNPAGTGPWSYWAGAGTGCSSASCAVAVTIGQPTTGNEVTGTITIPSSITPTGPLYVGFYNQDTAIAYAEEIASPSNSTGNNFTVYVPTGADYFFFAILDQNKNGLIDVGDVTDTNQNQAAISVSGPLTGQDLTLPAANSVVEVRTSYNQSVYNNGGTPSTYSNYGLDLNVEEGNKLPVAVTLMSGPNVISPVDMSNACQGCGSVQFGYYPNIATGVPKVGDTYTFQVTYSDTTTATVTGPVTAVLGPAQLATALAPNYNTTSPTTTPTFTWTYPANPGNYIYQFSLRNPNGGNDIWDIPSDNSSENGFTYTQIPMPAGLTWGVDPTESGNTPSVTSLTVGQTYYWSIGTYDSNQNNAWVQTYFTPQ